jgi:hypothetical protein
MMASRLSAYRRVRRMRECDGDLPGQVAEALRDVAEGLLLSGEDRRDQASLLETEAAVLLSRLVGAGVLTDTRAEALFFRVAACGPEGELALSG